MSKTIIPDWPAMIKENGWFEATMKAYTRVTYFDGIPIRQHIQLSVMRLGWVLMVGDGKLDASPLFIALYGDLTECIEAANSPTVMQHINWAPDAQMELYVSPITPIDTDTAKKWELEGWRIHTRTTLVQVAINHYREAAKESGMLCRFTKGNTSDHVIVWHKKP